MSDVRDDFVQIDGAIVSIPEGWRKITFGTVRKSDFVLNSETRRFQKVHPWLVKSLVSDFNCVIRRKR